MLGSIDESVTDESVTDESVTVFAESADKDDAMKLFTKLFFPLTIYLDFIICSLK